MMVTVASWPSAVVFWPEVMPAGQTSSAALTSARRTIALRIGGGGVGGVVEDASGALRAVSGGWIERLVLAARGDLAEDRAVLDVLAGEHGDGLAPDLSVTLGDDELAGVPAFIEHGHRYSYRQCWLQAA
jgi:hypothetical protein